ncbi:hypothetical protein VTH82DRAFT_353 [Thermothelomyces myriococcoides]
MPENHVVGAMRALRNLFRASIPGAGLLWVLSDEDLPRQCKGCGEICELLRWGEAQRRRDRAFQGSSPARIIHNSFAELDHCAGEAGCYTCPTLRRAFFLEQITHHDIEGLKQAGNQWPVYAVLNLTSSGDSELVLTVKAPKAVLYSANVHLTNDARAVAQNSRRVASGLRPDLGALRRVVEDCCRNHECSSRYRWSDRNPSWLLRILTDGLVQLVSGPPEPVDYVVLSYSWGDPAAMPAAEWARIKGAGTKTINGRPVPERLNPFSVRELPETMQDAIAISAALGVFYIWIDNVCIPKGTNWDTEASLMHEVYGNSVFTLVASSSTKATDPLLCDRLAWTQRGGPCRLRGLWWLHNTPMPLDRVRLESPVALRAWTLQEERLSPRILYWAGQRWYWSCLERQVAELGEFDWATSPADPCSRSCPQRFLEFCRTGDEELLHEEWLDIVQAYTRRDLVAPRDRFLAIAGLAVRFYNAKAANGGTVVTEDYLAGLWKDNFARHLAWSVTSAVEPHHNLRHIAPSWSWASLPLRVQTQTKPPFRPSAHFKFIAVQQVEADEACCEFTRAETGDPSTDFINRGRAVEERGRGVKVVEVQGRFRRFISDDALNVPWDSIERKREGRIGFDFGAFPGRSVYSRNKDNGSIVSKDAHCGEVVGQLDYIIPTDDKPNQHPTPYVREGGEREIVCLELGELAMLLLVPDHSWGRPESYRRVGTAIGYTNRKGFFYGCETRNVNLV